MTRCVGASSGAGALSRRAIAWDSVAIAAWQNSGFSNATSRTYDGALCAAVETLVVALVNERLLSQGVG